MIFYFNFTRAKSYSTPWGYLKLIGIVNTLYLVIVEEMDVDTGIKTMKLR